MKVDKFLAAIEPLGVVSKVQYLLTALIMGQASSVKPNINVNHNYLSRNLKFVLDIS